ncbi:carbohydrate ABC transporter permease [Cohnella candidum]|uniref:Sugar ABC transporter permease n=1 Tax=Cohnella candidum TaxID=2674991 RepID=A0A3G3JYR0_9BACL|nr:sugar ABC transporter permease [Cohnella candidum]AYQ73398.1 sugar ABC transporter permease [Cohnella candidum]
MTSRQIYWYLAPALLFTVVFFVFPILFVMYVDLHEWNGLGAMKFVGLDNFRFLFDDPSFKTATVNTIYWILAGIFLHTPLGLLLALILFKKPRGWKAFRLLFFLPNVISTTALAFLWYFVLHVSLGLVNNGLKVAGLTSWTHAWLSDPGTAVFANMVPFVLYVGFTMVIFLTQMSTISPDMYEAADIDGATSWQKDRYITIPLVKSAIGINIIFNTAFCLRMFEYPLLMTNGGPADSSLNLSLYIYREMITANRYGVSMAAGLVTILLGAVAMLLVFGVLRIGERRGLR